MQALTFFFIYLILRPNEKTGANVRCSLHSFELIRAYNKGKGAERCQNKDREGTKGKREKKDLFSHKMLAHWRRHQLIWAAHNEPK